MRAFYRALRILSAVTLFFFCWTFLPMWQAVAWATEKQPRMRNADFGMRNGKPEPATTGERFEKALEDIRENVGRAEKKHERGEDDKAEREHIRTKRTEIESLGNYEAAECQAKRKAVTTRNIEHKMQNGIIAAVDSRHLRLLSPGRGIFRVLTAE